MRRKKLLADNITVVKQQMKLVLDVLLNALDGLLPPLPSAHYPHAM
jgi:hypothetical protein